MKKEAFVSSKLQYFLAHTDLVTMAWISRGASHIRKIRPTWRTSWPRCSGSQKSGCCGTMWRWNLTPTTWNKCEIGHVSRGLL